MKAGTLNLPDLDFKMKLRLLKVCKSRHNFFFSLDRGFKKNWETEYLKYLDHLKCKVTKKTLMRSKPNNTHPHPPPQIGHGWGTGYIRGWRG